MGPSAAEMVCSYLRSMRAAQENGQCEHAEHLYGQALKWLHIHDEEDQGSLPVQFGTGVGLNAGKHPARQRNEDYVFATSLRCAGAQETIGLFVVADGIGGCAEGQEASRVGVHAFVDTLLPHLITSNQPRRAVRERLLEAMQRANEAVYRRRLELNQVMGTTLVAMALVGAEAFIVHAGDSRAYLYRPGEGLRQLTRDHSLVAQLVERQEILPQDVFSHPKRNLIYRSLGEAEVEVDELQYLQLHNHDVVLLCTDGLWEMVRDPQAAEIEHILSDASASAEAMALSLVDLALRGGGLDNIGLLVFKAQICVEEIRTIALAPVGKPIEG